MTTPFRDDLAAALGRVSELESENAELRERLSKTETAGATSAAEMDTALTTTHGLASRLQRENEELTAELAKARSERDALALTRRQLAELRGTPPPKWMKSRYGKGLAVLYGVAAVISAIAWLLDRLRRC
jgi:septal ring factor EnvC (AmiA/AmiB activator)